MAKKTTDKPGRLADAADALRRAAHKGSRDDDRTTLEVDDPEKRAGAPPDEIGEELVRKGIITRHQLFNALNEAYRTGGTLEQALVALGMVELAVLEKHRPT